MTISLFFWLRHAACGIDQGRVDIPEQTVIMLIETRFKEPGEFVWEQRTGPNYSLREEISSEETVVGGWGAGLGGGGSGFTAEFGKVERKGRTHLSTFTVYSIPGMLEPAERVADKEDRSLRRNIQIRIIWRPTHRKVTS